MKTNVTVDIDVNEIAQKAVTKAEREAYRILDEKIEKKAEMLINGSGYTNALEERIMRIAEVRIKEMVTAAVDDIFGYKSYWHKSEWDEDKLSAYLEKPLRDKVNDFVQNMNLDADKYIDQAVQHSALLLFEKNRYNKSFIDKLAKAVVKYKPKECDD